MAKDIIILPGSATVELYDTNNTKATWVYSSAVLDWKVSTTVYFKVTNTSPKFRLFFNNLYVFSTIATTAGTVVNNALWAGTTNTGPTGALVNNLIIEECPQPNQI